jgi:hypothetical protein
MPPKLSFGSSSMHSDMEAIERAGHVAFWHEKDMANALRSVRSQAQKRKTRARVELFPF